MDTTSQDSRCASCGSAVNVASSRTSIEIWGSAKGELHYNERDKNATFDSGINEVSDWPNLVDVPTSTFLGQAEFYPFVVSEVGNPNDVHARTALRSTPRHQSLVPINSTTVNFCEHFSCTMSCSWDPDSNYEGADHWDNRMRHIHKHLCYLEEDDMSSVSSNDQENPSDLFHYPPSEGRTSTTVGSSSVQQELTYNNIEHMLAVLKTERGKCLEELRGLDTALKTIDQLANRKRPGSEDCLNMLGSGVLGTTSP